MGITFRFIPKIVNSQQGAARFSQPEARLDEVLDMLKDRALGRERVCARGQGGPRSGASPPGGCRRKRPRNQRNLAKLTCPISRRFFWVLQPEKSNTPRLQREPRQDEPLSRSGRSN